MEIENDFQTTLEDNFPSIRAVFQKTGPVLSAYLFGSVAENVSNRLSDVDIAVRLTPELSKDETYRIRLHLMEMLEDLLERNVDVVILNDASLQMIHQVFKHGKPLYVRDDAREEAFRLQKRKEYFDFRYYIEKDRRDLRTFYGC